MATKKQSKKEKKSNLPDPNEELQTRMTYGELLGQQQSGDLEDLEKEFQQRMTYSELRSEEQGGRIKEQEKITKRLAKRVDRIAKTFNSQRFKRLFNNATPLSNFIENEKKKGKDSQLDDKKTKIEKFHPRIRLVNRLSILSIVKKCSYNPPYVLPSNATNLLSIRHRLLPLSKYPTSYFFPSYPLSTISQC